MMVYLWFYATNHAYYRNAPCYTENKPNKNILMRVKVFIIIFLCFLSSALSASEKLGAKSNPIRVGAIQIAPFVKLQGEQYSGLSVDLWKQIATQNQWHYQLLPVNTNIYEAIVALTKGKYDVLIGPISVTKERIKQIDFGRPFYLSQIKIAYNVDEFSVLTILFNVLYDFASPIFLLIIFIFIVVAHTIWFIEKKYNKDMPKSYLKGVIFSTWFFLIHLFKGGMIYKPTSKYGRLVILCWLSFALGLYLILSSTYTAYLTARVVNKNRHVLNLDKFRNKPLAYVEGEIYNYFIDNINAIPVAKPSLEMAFNALEQEKVYGIVDDELVLDYKIKKMQLKNIKLSHSRFYSDEFAFAYPKNSPLRALANIVIVTMQDDERMKILCQQYLGIFAKHCQF
jgi:polar amino acid transport system substrate-binding protein